MYAYIFHNKSAVRLLKLFKETLRDGDIIFWLEILKLIYIYFVLLYILLV